MKIESKLIVVLGATASGKTAVAARLASETGSEIISADSRQVYRGLNIGSGKDLGEYVIDGRPVPYHLIDIIDPLEEFSVYHYQKRFFEIFEKITANGIVPIMVGGTGLYIDSVLGRYDMAEAPEDRGLRSQLAKLDDGELAARLQKLNPELHNTTDLKDRNRIIRAIEIALSRRDNSVKLKALPEINPLVIGLKWPREILRARILSRLKSRLNEGMIDEVEGLHAEGIGWERLDYFGLEYRFVAQYLQGKMNRNDMTQKLHSAICQFAKRQETWFRRMERRGTDIHWVENADYEKVREIVASELPA